jgi:glycosyltransferase involved in cell wall biosynthesis
MNAPKLTILQIITPRRFSGAEREMLYLSEGLQQRGHRVVVACKRNPDLQAALQERGLPVHPLPIAGKLNFAAPLILAREARRIQADVVHTHLSTAAQWGGLMGKLTGLPVLAHVHSMNSKVFFSLADHLIACSEGVRRHLIAQGVPPERVDVACNGLPARLFTGLAPAAQVRQDLNLPPGAPVIGVVAHLSLRKGHRYLLEALPILLRRFPDLVCLIVGEGALQANLEAHARQLGVAQAVRFLGFRPDAVQLMVGMDVVVLPSVAKEGLGLALIEAGFLGKPTVASAAPGIDEVVVDGETGLLAPPGDAAALASCLAQVLADPALADRLGDAGRRRVQQHFSVDAMAERTEAIYRKILSRNPRRRSEVIG